MGLAIVVQTVIGMGLAIGLPHQDSQILLPLGKGILIRDVITKIDAPRPISSLIDVVIIDGVINHLDGRPFGLGQVWAYLHNLLGIADQQLAVLGDRAFVVFDHSHQFLTATCR